MFQISIYSRVVMPMTVDEVSVCVCVYVAMVLTNYVIYIHCISIMCEYIYIYIYIYINNIIDKLSMLLKYLYYDVVTFADAN